jgi:hypothetical protein
MRSRLRDHLTRHPRLVTIGAIGAVVILGVAVGLAIAALRDAPVAGDATQIPSASGSPNSSETPAASLHSTSETPEPTATPPLIPYVADAQLLQVDTDGLRMRASAGTSAEVLRTLERGEVVRVQSGPVDADGYPWYEVVDLDSRIGWVAMGGGAQPWLATVPAGAATSPLLLRFERGCDAFEIGMTGFPADVTLSADGRVVVWSSFVRQLNPAGLARVRQEVLQLPVLQATAMYQVEPRPGVPEAPGHGACINRFTLGEGAERVVVSAINWQGDQEEATYYLPAPERRALDELAMHLADIEAWLGPSAWTEPLARRYISSSYQLWIYPQSGAPPSYVDAPSVSGAVWPFDGPIEQFGGTDPQQRCGYLDSGQAFETLRVMRLRGVRAEAAGVDPPRVLSLDGFGSGSFSTEGGWFSFWLTPRSPDGYPSCVQ